MEEGIEDVLNYGAGSGFGLGRAGCTFPYRDSKHARASHQDDAVAGKDLVGGVLAIGKEQSTRGASGVGEDHEWPDGVGGYVVFDGVNSAVMGQGLVLWVGTIAPIIQEELRRPEVCPNGFLCVVVMCMDETSPFSTRRFHLPSFTYGLH
ncbi:hypothetical protein SUGI_0715000 [Cryptomeria japonica]|nr:hypothetical protein SUGI_0715000 [Cryptomeria japonica]